MTTTDIKDTTYTNGSAAVKTAKDAAARVKDAVSDAAIQAQATATDALDAGLGEYDRLSRQSARFVRENPGVAVAGALGVGLILGLALRLRD